MAEFMKQDNADEQPQSDQVFGRRRPPDDLIEDRALQVLAMLRRKRTDAAPEATVGAPT